MFFVQLYHLDSNALSSCCFKGINIESNETRKIGLLYVFVESNSQGWGCTYLVMNPLELGSASISQNPF
jgi:hypothetical protein